MCPLFCGLVYSCSVRFVVVVVVVVAVVVAVVVVVAVAVVVVVNKGWGDGWDGPTGCLAAWPLPGGVRWVAYLGRVLLVLVLVTDCFASLAHSSDTPTADGSEMATVSGVRVGHPAPAFDDARFINKPVLILDGGTDNFPIQNKWIR